MLSFQFKRSTIFVDVAQSKNTIPVMSESATRPNLVSDQLGRHFGRSLTGCSGLVFFEKVARFLFFKQSCQKPTKVLTMLKVVEVVKVVAGEGRGVRG